jgi:hypothetical protein
VPNEKKKKLEEAAVFMEFSTYLGCLMKLGEHQPPQSFSFFSCPWSKLLLDPDGRFELDPSIKQLVCTARSLALRMFSESEQTLCMGAGIKAVPDKMSTRQSLQPPHYSSKQAHKQPIKLANDATV